MLEIALIVLVFVLLYMIYIITYKDDKDAYINKLYEMYEINLKETDLIIKQNNEKIKLLKEEIEQLSKKWEFL